MTREGKVYSFMALEIMIVKNASKPYWEDPDAFLFGEIDPVEWESFFFNDLDIKRYTEYNREDSETYEEYYASRISSLEKKFPLITRIRDYYEDAFFSKQEVSGLINEILSLQNVVEGKQSVNFLNQLLAAGEKAIRHDSGITLVAD